MYIPHYTTSKFNVSTYLRYVLFWPFSLTTKPETNWTQKDLYPPITEHHVNVRLTLRNVFLTGVKMLTITNFLTENMNVDDGLC